MELYEKIIFYLATGVLTVLLSTIGFMIKRFIKKLDLKFDLIFKKNDEQNKDINTNELAIEKIDGKLHTTNEKIKGLDGRVDKLEIKTA